ncbi:MAG: hypothetical protein NTW94_02765 [Legionellales bacterium]|nr:hypothetical protein [Legionellales bacterium]
MSGRPPKKRVTQDQHAKNEAARKAAEKKARIEAADQAVKHFERQEEIEAENRFVELECQANKYLKDPVAIKYTHLIALFERIKPDGHFLTTEQKAFIKDLYGKVELKHSLREERRRQREKELAADDLEKRRVEERKEVQNLTTKYERLISVIEQLTVASNRTTNKHSAFVCMNLENSRKYLSIERDLKKAKEAFVIKYPLLVTQLTQIEASLSKRKDEFNSAEKKRETREKLAKNANKKDLESRATSTPASDEQAVVTKGRSTDRERWLQAEYLHVQKTLNTAAFASADMTSYGQRAIQGELEKLFPTGPNLSSLIKWYPQIMRENSSNHELRLSYTGKNGHPGSFTVNLAEITLQVVTDLLDALTKAGAAPENMRIDLLSTPSDSRTLRPDESTLVLRTKRPIEDSNHKIKISSDNRDLIGVWTKPHEKSLMRFCSKLTPSQNILHL